jgi:hypothetical protein
VEFEIERPWLAELKLGKPHIRALNHYRKIAGIGEKPRLENGRKEMVVWNQLDMVKISKS